MKLICILITMLFTCFISAQTNTGIGTVTPTERLDVGVGNVRIRDINTIAGIGGTDKVVVADATGVLKTLNQGVYTLFHARLAANQAVSAGVITTLLFATPLSMSAIYSYDATTGTLTFNEAGNYLITLQASFTNIAANTQLLIGIRPMPDANYLGRGSHYNVTAVPVGIGELMQYTTMLVVPSVGYQIRFTAYAGTNATVLETEIGTTGSGSVSNVTVQKI